MLTQLKNYEKGSLVFDSDPEETAEWLEALDDVIRFDGGERCTHLLAMLNKQALSRGVSCASPLNTPYCNSISTDRQPTYPGDLKLERKITGLVRWNALAMVMRSNKTSNELGGHLASYASAAELFEVGFNHFFRGGRPESSAIRTADLVFLQPHSAPGVYARAFLEGRLTEENLNFFRREVAGNGLCSYPHPRLMPSFWEFPTGSMGLGPLTAIYQARFMRYLENRGLIQPTERRVWVFVGDGEMDEPESLAGLSIAARESLDNLTFVVNCNLQRLDGPVRGNSSIIQELERLYSGMGWNVIKLLWGSDWDDLFARDEDNFILKRLAETKDGELQSYSSRDATFNRERFFNRYPDLQALTSHLSDEQIDGLTRGGHDPIKIFAAFDAAIRHKGQPTVILAQTKKGFGLGRSAEGRMSSHQQKKLQLDALRSFRDRFELSLSDTDLEEVRFFRPASDSPEMRYLLDQRHQLGGFLPCRHSHCPKLAVPASSTFGDFCFNPGNREMSTTVAFVRMLSSLLKDESLGKNVVPIVADEARTFGMESLFRKVGIYSHCGQLYDPEDKDDLLFYREARDGQILEEGINEAGALASWIAAGTSYSQHAVPMLPFYIFYSMFGFQRVADLIWAAADSRARGFLLGATAGRTTLSGEGLQHQDGSSHLVASTIPACRAYDPCFAYEVAVIVEHGMRVMLEEQEDFFFYLTLMNESYAHEPMPDCAEEGILKGMHQIRHTSCSLGESEGARGLLEAAPRPRIQFLGSGTILREVIAAGEILARDYKIESDVWSVTSFSELRRDGLSAERANRFGTSQSKQLSWVETSLNGGTGPVIAASDYVRAVPDLIRTWVPRRYITLGTDGFGRSDTRESLRKFFEVDRLSIVLASIAALIDEGSISPETRTEFLKQYHFAPPTDSPWEK